MWEEINANVKKTIIIFIITGLIFLLAGLLVMMIFGPTLEEAYGLGRWFIVLLFLVIWLALGGVSYFYGDTIFLKLSGAKKADRDSNQQLFNIVEEMKIAANLPVMPEIYIIPSSVSNAFATGIKLEKSSIVVTEGLLEELNRNELQAVIAHEISHITNKDMLLLTFVGTMWSAFAITVIVLIILVVNAADKKGKSKSSNSSSNKRTSGDMLSIWAIWRSFKRRKRMGVGRRKERKTRKPLYTSILSKTREYLADASAVRLTRNPEALASALEKIAIEDNELESANKITAPMYIENPLKANLNSHPPIEKRIKILRAMSKGASYAEYQKCYSDVTGESKSVIPESVLKKDK